MINWNKYVGIPYKLHGRDFYGCDCWGLICLVYKIEYGINLDRYFYNDIDEGHSLLLKEKVNFEKTNDPVIGDIALFLIAGAPSHVGVVIGSPNEKNLLHTVAEHDSAIDRYNSPRWVKRLEGFYHVS